MKLQRVKELEKKYGTIVKNYGGQDIEFVNVKAASDKPGSKELHLSKFKDIDTSSLQSDVAYAQSPIALCLATLRLCIDVCADCIEQCLECPNTATAEHQVCIAACKDCLVACTLCLDSFQDMDSTSADQVEACQDCATACQTCQAACQTLAGTCSMCAADCNDCATGCAQCVAACQANADDSDEMSGDGQMAKEAKPIGLLQKILMALKQGARHSASDQGMIQTIHDHAASLGADCAMNVKQAQDGSWRWTLLSSNAYRDRDKEIVSTKALEADCARADTDGYYGPLRWWHVGEYDVTTKQAGPGADLGMCDFNAMHGRILIESGTFKNETIARAVQKQAAQLESSIGFFHPLTEPDGEGTYTSIRRFERSLLPKGKAANPLTALTVITKETQAMKKEKLEALETLLGSDEAANVVKQAEVVQKAADAAGLTFKAKQDEPVEPPIEEPKVPVEVDTLKEMTDTLAASLAPVIEAKVKEQVGAALAAYTVAVETKAAGQQAQIEELKAALKALVGDLPRNASRGVNLTESDKNIVADAKTKEFDPENTREKAPLEGFTNWLVTGKMAA